eukprot:g6042.t1
MGKVNKRQRKFLSKKVLPHRKKGGARRDNNKNKPSKAGGGDGDGATPTPTAGEQQRKTLPDGVDTAAFLECGWLSRDACAAAGRDTCVTPFDPDAALLEVAGAPAKPVMHGKKSGKGGTKHSGGLTPEAARSLVARAVENGSIDDLLRAVWGLQAAAATTSTATTPALPASSPAAGRALRAAAGSEAAKTLRSEALSRLHLAFRAHLGPEREEGDSPDEWEDAVRAHRQKLEKSEAWPRLGGALLSFLTTTLDHLEAEAEEFVAAAAAAAAAGKTSSASAVPLVEGLARLKDHVPLLFPFPRLARRYLAFLLGVLESTDDASALSLAFVRVYELATSQPMPFLHDAFKGAYRCYRTAAERVGARGRGAATATAGSAAGGKPRSGGGGGAGSLPLLRECFAELLGVEKPSAYLHAYVYIHDLAREALEAAAEVHNGRGKTREAGPALRRLRSWEFLQSLQLWTNVVAAHAAKYSLGPLVPPLAKTLEITFQLSPGVYGAPRTLALARGAQDLAAASGVFLPTSHHLVTLLELLHARASGGGRDGGEEDQADATRSGKKRGRGGGAGEGAAAAAAAAAGAPGAEVDLSAVAGLGKGDLKVAAVRVAVTRAAAGLIAREAVCYRWSAGLPELCASTRARLGRLLDEGGGLAADGGGAAGRCRARVRALQASLDKAAAEAVARRARGGKNPGEAGPVDTFRGTEESTATQRLRLFKEPS